MNNYEAYNELLTDEDLFNLDLLNNQLIASILNIASDLYSYMSTVEGIDLIYAKYLNPQEVYYGLNPDVAAIKSSYLALFARTILTKIGFNKYNHLYLCIKSSYWNI